jgi:hypothetical protein
MRYPNGLSAPAKQFVRSTDAAHRRAACDDNESDDLIAPDYKDADRLWPIADGRVGPCDGDLDDYRSPMLSRGNDRNGPGGKGPGERRGDLDECAGSLRSGAGQAGLNRHLGDPGW